MPFSEEVMSIHFSQPPAQFWLTFIEYIFRQFRFLISNNFINRYTELLLLVFFPLLSRAGKDTEFSSAAREEFPARKTILHRICQSLTQAKDGLVSFTTLNIMDTIIHANFHAYVSPSKF